MIPLHPLLVQQIERYLGNTYTLDGHLQQLLSVISQSYTHCDMLASLSEEGKQCFLHHLQSDADSGYQRLVECSTDMIYTCDAKGYFRYMNPVTCRTFGYTLEYLQTHQIHFLDIVDPKYRQKVEAFYKSQFTERLIDTYLEFPCINLEGKIIWIGHNVHLQWDESRNWVIGFQGISRDITAIKEAEEKLLQAKTIAEESVKAKDHFFSVMSHELRTPLNAVIGLSHLLLDENPLPGQVEHLQAIKHSADSLMMIINDLLDFSKIESGKVTFEKTDFMIADIFQGIEKSFRFKANLANLRFLTQIEAGVPIFLTGDPFRLNQILLNLVSNAIKFTEKGFVELKATELIRTSEMTTIEFSVTDTGIGIPENRLETIFDSFTQATHETVRKYGGTGLGLTITKRLVELQGGTIQVESKVGMGSIFSVRLSFGVPSVTTLMPDANVASLNDASLQNTRVLLVEDNRMNQLVVKKFLEKWGVQMEIAENGIEAIEKLRNELFDIILMDLQMPQMDGYKATRYIRYSMEGPVKHTPIVAITASTMTDVCQKAREAGMNDLITKPFDFRDLYLKILKHSRKGYQLPEDNSLFAVSVQETTKGYVNLHYLEEISAHNNEFIADMIRLFIRQVPQFMQKLRMACTQSNWPEIRYITHKMKSSLVTIGIFELESVLRHLETCNTEESDLNEVSQMVAHMERVCEEVYTELAEKLKELLNNPIVQVK